MKKIILALLLVLALVTTSEGQRRIGGVQRGGPSGAGDPLRTPTGGGSGSPPAGGHSALYTGAVAVWDFENNANDTKGTYNLTATGTPTYSTTGEAQGTYWAVLNGSSQWYSHAGNAAFAFTGDYSISMWVQFDTIEWLGGLIEYYDSSNSGNGWSVRLSTDNGGDIVVEHRTSYSGTTASFTSANLTTGTRYHIVLIYSDSGNTVTAYVSTTTFGDVVNGTTAAMTANPGNAGTGGTLYIGKTVIEDLLDDGNFDEVVLWNSAITSTNAQAIFNARDGGTSWR